MWLAASPTILQLSVTSNSALQQNLLVVTAESNRLRGKLLDDSIDVLDVLLPAIGHHGLMLTFASLAGHCLSSIAET